MYVLICLLLTYDNSNRLLHHFAYHQRIGLHDLVPIVHALQISLLMVHAATAQPGHGWSFLPQGNQPRGEWPLLTSTTYHYL
jgi:hypothetical protein